MEPLHLVTKEELPILFEWTAKHLPHTVKIYETLNSELQGLWDGPTYYTLGWPEILAVGEGPVDPAKCKCSIFFNELRHTCVFSPNNEHLEELITRPGFLDWTKPIMFIANCNKNMDVVERISLATGAKYSKRFVNYLFMAQPGEVPLRPLPDGFEIRPLDPDLHAEYVTSTWGHRRPHTELYVYEILKRFPSAGIFDRVSVDATECMYLLSSSFKRKISEHLGLPLEYRDDNPDGKCVGVELTQEFGFGGLLYVEDEFRGRGLASCLITHLAQKRFHDNRPFVAAVIENNHPSLAVHEKLGLKKVCKVDWFIHSMNEKVIRSQ